MNEERDKRSRIDRSSKLQRITYLYTIINTKHNSQCHSQILKRCRYLHTISMKTQKQTKWQNCIYPDWEYSPMLRHLSTKYPCAQHKRTDQHVRYAQRDCCAHNLRGHQNDEKNNRSIFEDQASERDQPLYWASLNSPRETIPKKLNNSSAISLTSTKDGIELYRHGRK